MSKRWINTNNTNLAKDRDQAPNGEQPGTTQHPCLTGILLLNDVLQLNYMNVHSSIFRCIKYANTYRAPVQSSWYYILRLTILFVDYFTVSVVTSS